MGSIFGHQFRVTTFGESHGPAVGAVIDGCPPSVPFDLELAQIEMDRRRPGTSALVSARDEPDRLEVLSGIRDGVTLGGPIALLVRNLDARPQDYAELETALRPGHADLALHLGGGVRDARGGGRASARETAARVAAGAVARRLLASRIGVDVIAWVDSVGGVRSGEIDEQELTHESVHAHPARCPDLEAAAAMAETIDEARASGDSVGATVRCVARGVPAGWGEPVFDKLTADLAKALMSIPAARAFEMGEGLAAASMRGSEHNDAIRMVNGEPRAISNRAGGVLGGLTTGLPLRTRVAFKPVPTIARPQRTVTVDGREIELCASGRHDPCVGPRAVPVVEAMVLLVLADHYLRSLASA